MEEFLDGICFRFGSKNLPRGGHTHKFSHLASLYSIFTKCRTGKGEVKIVKNNHTLIIKPVSYGSSKRGASNYGDIKRRLDEIIKKIDLTLESTPEKKSTENLFIF